MTLRDGGARRMRRFARGRDAPDPLSVACSPPDRAISVTHRSRREESACFQRFWVNSVLFLRFLETSLHFAPGRPGGIVSWEWDSDKNPTGCANSDRMLTINDFPAFRAPGRPRPPGHSDTTGPGAGMRSGRARRNGPEGKNAGGTPAPRVGGEAELTGRFRKRSAWISFCRGR